MISSPFSSLWTPAMTVFAVEFSAHTHLFKPLPLLLLPADIQEQRRPEKRVTRETTWEHVLAIVSWQTQAVCHYVSTVTLRYRGNMYEPFSTHTAVY